MRRILGLVTVALAAASVVAITSPPVGAGGPPAVDYTCAETSSTGLVPNINVPVDIIATGPAALPKVFQPVTWTATLQEPNLLPPLSINLHYLRVRVPIPANVTAVSATLVAAPGETPNPALNLISLEVTADEVIVLLPGTPGASNRIRAASAADGGGLTYPSNILSIGNPVVLPQVQITGVPTPAASGGDVTWRAPELDTAVTITAQDVTLTCAPDLDPDPAINTTSVDTAVQLCDGRAVTMQADTPRSPSPAPSPTTAGLTTAGTTGADVIQGTAFVDTVNSLGGTDRFCGLNGNDVHNGGGANDRALGGGGNDRLSGGGGDDFLNGGVGTDTLNGGAGRDTCNGGTQTDTGTACEVKLSIP